MRGSSRGVERCEMEYNEVWWELTERQWLGLYRVSFAWIDIPVYS